MFTYEVKFRLNSSGGRLYTQEVQAVSVTAAKEMVEAQYGSEFAGHSSTRKIG